MTYNNYLSIFDVDLDTFRLILENLVEIIQNGLTLGDIENILVFILLIRFLIVSLRYNLKTSFYITCIGLLAGYFWYRSLVDHIYLYRNTLLNVPFLYGLGMDGVRTRIIAEQNILTESKLRLGENVRFYNPFQIIYYAFVRGIRSIDTETQLPHYIDPISMIVANLPESIKSSVAPAYYEFYIFGVPKLFIFFKLFWKKYGEIALYITITRLGKRYCPYLIRWHWTLSIIISLLQPILHDFVKRATYFKNILAPQVEVYRSSNYIEYNDQIVAQVYVIEALITSVVLLHIGFIVFAMFHAICGQYFYIPFIVKNVELHVGKRPVNSIYSGGYTPWQDLKEKNSNPFLFVPKIWYGWLFTLNKNLKRWIKNILRKVKKRFSR